MFTEGVANRSDLGCMFPDQSTPATFVSPTELRCLAPPTNSSSTQCRGEALEVTLLTGQATKNAVPLLRVPSPAILGVQPSRGYYRAPQWVRLTGYGYVDSQQLSCLFYNEAGLQVSPHPTPPHPNAPHPTPPHPTPPHPTPPHPTPPHPTPPHPTPPHPNAPHPNAPHPTPPHPTPPHPTPPHPNAPHPTPPHLTPTHPTSPQRTSGMY